MASWISLVVLSAVVVSTTLSLPQPDGAYNIPRVGTGRRSQYYVLHNDGTYKYGHDTGEGAFESAKSSAIGQQQGTFGYVDPQGNSINLQYEAGEAGFIPSGAHLPQPHPDFYAAHAEANARPPFVDPLANPNTDATYGFQFAEQGQTRSENSDSNGNIRGSYSYTDEDGNTRTYSYTAGRNTGFVVQGSDLPLSPETPHASGSTPAATSYSSSGNTFSQSSHRGSPSRLPTSISSAYTPSFSSATASVRAGSSSSSFSGSSSSSQSAVNNDGSYSFSFDAGDHSRSESADANLNVEGQFSFIADDGVRRRVDYEAGADTGFIASGDHLPKAPSANNAASTSHSTAFRGSASSSTSSGLHSNYRAPTTSSSSSSAANRFSGHRQSGSQTYSASSSGRPIEEANTRSELRPDGSYSFEYETSSHSRKEAGDSNNNVDGDFAFIADDGQQRQITYEAGSDTGFIAQGSHIPVGPIVPGAPSGQPTGRIVPVKQIPFIDPLADTNADASYNFDFDSEQYSRSETSDADGNVQGSYTVVDDDGTRRTYSFRAGEGIGFETQEVSSSRGPRPSRPSHHSSSPSTRGSFSSSSATSHTGSFSSSSPSFASQSHSARGHSSASTRYTAPSSHTSDASGFQLHQYEASKNPNKFGYVLTFDS